MNNSKESHKLVRQNEKNVQKSQKHDANLQKNSTLYFQIGLILCLLASYTALEATFAVTTDSYASNVELDDEIYEIVPENYKIEKKVEVKKTKPPVKAKEPDVLKIVDDETKMEEAVEKIIEIAEPTKPTKEVDPNDFDIVEPVDPGPFNIMAVQKVPVYPGCESAKNNNERRQCMSDKLRKLIQRKFDGDVGVELGLSGKQKIMVGFKINKNGEVEIQKIRAPHKGLEKEAKRVVNKIPQMQPGKNNDRPVEVSYMLPIVFNVL